MASLDRQILIELDNLFNEFNTLITITQDSNTVTKGLVEVCIESIKSRLSNIIRDINLLLNNSNQLDYNTTEVKEEGIETQVTIPGKELVKGYIEYALLVWLIKLALSVNKDSQVRVSLLEMLLKDGGFNSEYKVLLDIISRINI